MFGAPVISSSSWRSFSSAARACAIFFASARCAASAYRRSLYVAYSPAVRLRIISRLTRLITLARCFFASFSAAFSAAFFMRSSSAAFSALRTAAP